jgi:D-lactate dehydrogenase (cytochrome)
MDSLHEGHYAGVSGIAIIEAQLADLLGDRFTRAPAACQAHAQGEGVQGFGLPEAVVFPQDAAEVAAILAACNRAGVPVIPFGTGTSLEGQLAPLFGGISLDMRHFDAILQVSPDDLDCRVQACVTREQLNAHLRDMGLFFPIDPGANASLGGMASTRASGTNAVRYGTMRDLTLGCTVVTPAGAVIRTGGRARKSSAGYDLTRLYVGSEGTLGVITELQLRLFPIPERIAAATATFPTVQAATLAVVAVLQAGVPIARIELLDSVQMRACIAYSNLGDIAPLPGLFLEFHGSPAGVAEQVAQVEAIVAEHGGSALRWAMRTEDRTKLWQARHNAYWAARALAPGKASFATDVCVPISQLAICIAQAQALAERSGLVCPIVGHVGDGNFHMMVLHDPGERARADQLALDVSRLALAHGGTCSGEHGIGLHKLGVMAEEHGEAVEVMRAIKAALDPNGIMNPGKTIPPRADTIAFPPSQAAPAG